MLKTLSNLTITSFLMSMLMYLILLPFIHYPITTLLKPIPLLFLMHMAWQSKTPNRILMLTALGFSLIGDIMLTLPIKEALYGGILFFMLAHCAYIKLFLKQAQFQWHRLSYFLPVLLFVSISFYCLLPYLGTMTIAAMLYLSLLTSMVFCSFQVKRQAFLIISGAMLFLLSDFTLAVGEFINPNSKQIAILIMLSYYIAQFMIILGNSILLIQEHTLKKT